METIRKKGKTLFRQIALGMVLLVVIVIASIITNYYTSVANDNVVKAYLIEKDFSNYYISLKNAETGQRGYLLTLDSIYLTDYTIGVANFRNTAIKLAHSQILSNAEKKEIKVLNKLAEVKLIELNKTIGMASGYQLEEALEIVDSDRGKNIMDSIIQKFDHIRNNENQRIIEAKSIEEQYKVISNIITFFGLIVILYLGYNVVMEIQPMVTELMNNKESLQKNVETLSIKNTQLENFAYIASHDLKEPLRTVSNFVDLLEEEGALAKLDEEEQHYFSFIQKAVDRMNNLINGLLTYSKLGRSNSIVSLDLNMILNAVIENLDASIEQSNTKITYDALPTIVGLEIELIQLFQNLISNAIKFAQININPIIHISCIEEEDHWQFSVKDNGIGIPEGKQKDIFKFMTKLHREEEYAGYGLGLAFCEKVINLHHGAIWAESEINKGSTFHFTISKKII